MMRRSRVSEMPQRQSLRAAHHQRTVSSESDRSHPMMTKRPTADKNSKISGRSSPRNPLLEKKLRSRISDLESQLGQVQEELKKFKEQLSFAEVDEKREAQEVVEQTNEQIPAVDENSSLIKLQEENAISISNLETEALALSLDAVSDESRIDLTHVPIQEESETKPIDRCSELVAEHNEQGESLNLPERTELSGLEVTLALKEMEIETICAENDKLKQQASEAAAKVSMAQSKEEETTMKLSHIGVELEESRAEAARVAAELKAAEEAKVALETEIKRLRVQTEQWKKAASAAASMLAGEVDTGGQGVAAQSISLGKHVGEFELAGHRGFDVAGDFEEGLESGKRKGTATRMFGDLWKKRGHK